MLERALELLGRFVFRQRWPVLIAAGTFLAVSLVFLARGGELTTGTIRNIEAYDAAQLVQRVLGHPQETTFIALFRTTDLDPTSDTFKAAMAEAVDPLRKDSRVLSVVTPADAPQFLAEGMVNPKARSALVLITLAGDLRHAVQNYPSVRRELSSNRLIISCTGQLPFVSDLDITLEHDLVHAEAISLPLALIVLLAVFGTAVAAVLPAGVGGLAVVGGIAAVYLLSRTYDIAQYTINVCSLIGLGVAIDYSLFIVSRYREEIANGRSYHDALVQALTTAGRVVLFSGLAVAMGLSGLWFFEGSYLRAIGLSGAVVVALAVIFALTFLPALLAVLGPRIQAGRMPFGRLAIADGMWHRMADWVMRRPVAILAPTLTLILLMGIPFRHVELATADVRVLDESVEARSAFEQLRADFPSKAATRVDIAIRFPTVPILTPDRISAVFDFSRRLWAMPHVQAVESIVDGPDKTITRETYQEVLINPPAEVAPLVEMAKKQVIGDHVMLVYALLDVPKEDPAAREFVKKLREDRRVGDGTFLVGGETARDIDSTQYIVARVPKVIYWVVGMTVLILFLLLDSVILPLKAVVMNVLSITGSFGAIVWIFQDGHLWVKEPLPLEPSLPVLLFCALFGLSMDYEVLMLSRIKESYQRTGDNTRAVAEGLEKTAGLITSAASIMVAVFAAFSLARVVDIQAVGFGMALAVAMDATLVRVLLVPATMRLFGELNWWSPKPLKELRRTLRLLVKRDDAPTVTERRHDDSELKAKRAARKAAEEKT
jgi:RND superfamily putative drug exporter